MSDKRSLDFFYFSLRVFVGVIFAYAGFMKLLQPASIFEISLSNYPIIPEIIRPAISVVIPWIEWLVGVFVILGYMPRVFLKVALFFLVSFLVLLASGPLMGRDVPESCGCFGERGLQISSKLAFFLDFLALISCVTLILKKKFPFSLEGKLNLEQG